MSRWRQALHGGLPTAALAGFLALAWIPVACSGDGPAPAGDSGAPGADLADAAPDVPAVDAPSDGTETPSDRIADEGPDDAGTPLPEGGFVQIDAGNGHTCGITRQGSLWCWGRNESGQLGLGISNHHVSAPRQVGTDSDWDAVAAGSGHTCAIKAGGQLWCWSVATASVPARVGSEADWHAVAAGRHITCAIKGAGQLWCLASTREFGGPTSGVSDPGKAFSRVGEDEDWKVVSAGDLAWALKAEGELWRLRFDDERLPVAIQLNRVGDRTDWRSVSGGASHTCATTQDHRLWCWGSNQNGQLGLGTRDNQDLPVQVGAQSDWEDVTASHEHYENHTCAIRAGGQLWCWGANADGELGQGATSESADVPQRVGADADWKTLSAGGMHVCALKAGGELWCWGSNGDGQIGQGAAGAKRDQPYPVTGSPSFAGLSMGEVHSCGVGTDHRLWCWGANSEQQASVTPTGYQFEVPGLVGDDTDWLSVSAGGFHTCGLRAAGQLWCWGANTSGQTGTGGTELVARPTQVGTDDDWSQVSPGTESTCALKAGGQLWCWGRGEYGRLGLGPVSDDVLEPRRVGADTDWSDVSVGRNHTCAVKAGGEIWCWGWNNVGALGLGTSGPPYEYDTPQRAGADSDFKQVAAGQGHTCAIKGGGQLWCWGNPYAAGSGTKVHPILAPQRVGDAAHWVAVTAGGLFACALTNQDALWCWGDNRQGQVGVGSTDGQLPSPLRVGSDSDWVRVAAGSSHTCASRRDGMAWCWGDNLYGQLGDGNSWYDAPRRVR